jgi:hypothetical protein
LGSKLERKTREPLTSAPIRAYSIRKKSHGTAMLEAPIPRLILAIALVGNLSCLTEPRGKLETGGSDTGLTETGDIDPSKLDTDEDGYIAEEDCDDNNPNIHPDAEEICNGVDDDCDELIDDADDSLNPNSSSDWYRDADNDGYGDESDQIHTCEKPDGYVEESESGFDCDDDDPEVHPSADEVCGNGIDDDCDESTLDLFDGDGDGADCATDCDDDNGSVTVVEDWYIDCDGDGVLGFGTVSSCGSEGTCPGPSDPQNANTLSPKTWDCYDDDPADLYCHSCLEILQLKPSAADGQWMIDGDGSTGAAFAVECDMSGGGWMVLHDEDFSAGTNAGWLDGGSSINVDTSSNCAATWSNFLGGYNSLGAGQEAAQTFSTFGVSHTEARAELDYIVVDSWDYEAGVVEIDGVKVWGQEFKYNNASSNVCGGGSWKDHGPQAVDEAVAHTSGSVTVRLSSSLNQASDDESFGLDNVRVTIR